MKNISRRVFIKGMAVAAVATAASTVLTGCKFPGTEEPVVEVPADSKVFTYTDPKDSKKVLTLNFSDMIKGNADFDSDDKDLAVINIDVRNDLADIKLNDVPTSAQDAYHLSVTAYQDGHTGMTSGIISTPLSGTWNKGDKKAAVIKLNLKDVKSSVTLKVTLLKTMNSSSNKDEVASEKLLEQEITYSL